jgi:mannosyl-oligosaccharide glucosidase
VTKTEGNTPFLRVSEESDVPPDPIYSPHTGYVNLFPLLLGLLDPETDIEIIRGTFDLIQSELVSPFGLMSLSPNDSNFGQDENYWRGNIWANMNLLAVGSLAYYGKKMVKIDPTLSANMLETSIKLKSGWLQYAIAAWEASGGPREYLKPLTGEGGGVYPFAGWTTASIVILLKDDQEDWWEKSILNSEYFT